MGVEIGTKRFVERTLRQLPLKRRRSQFDACHAVYHQLQLAAVVGTSARCDVLLSDQLRSVVTLDCMC